MKPLNIVPFNRELKYMVNDFIVEDPNCSDGKFFEEYLKNGALEDQEMGKCVTHVFIGESEQKENRIIGYVTLRTSSYNIPDHNNCIGSFPAIEIEKIAVDHRYRRNNYGTDLLNHVVYVANKVRLNYVGVEYIVTCAVQEALCFYTANEFEKFSDYYEIIDNTSNVYMFKKLP